MWARDPRMNFEEPRPSHCGKREAFSKRVWARISPPGDFEGASIPASGAAASTGHFEAVPPAPWGEGARGRGDEERLARMPRTNVFDLAPYLGAPLDVYEAFSRTRGL